MRTVNREQTRSAVGALLLLAVALAPAMAQETRSMIFGRVLDQSGAAVVRAQVVVKSVDTNSSVRLSTNETGYYEAPLLVPGNYEVSAEASGFKKVLRKGITLPISTRAQIDLVLEIGATSDSVSVTAEAPLLETNAVSTGQIIDQRSLQDLPTLNNNPTLLARMAPGIQTTGGAAGYTNGA
ncbi:MAG TPA: carboxypeptidase-like regulatory domain-containing protein, partial [Armatimonadota bacterium]